jgi:peptidyl-prolyl cis-trans isomerase C
MVGCRFALSLTLTVILAGAVPAQQGDPPPPPPVNTAPPADAVAATVNGQPIPEIAVYRAMESVKVAAAQRDAVRRDVINFLADNALIDQYLDGLKVAVDAKDVDVEMEKVKAELKTQGKDFAVVLQLLHLTEAEMRAQLQASMRWDKFLQQYATDKALKDFFEANKAMFDGSQVRAKHILLEVKAGDAKSAEDAKAQLAGIRKQIEEKVAKDLAAAGQLDNLELQKKRLQLVETAFADVASKVSVCPTKVNGGELSWFPRVGGRIAEPFARAAFALKPGELSDPVVTDFGCHLILVLDTKPGVDRKFEDIKQFVVNVFNERMRDAVLQQMRPSARIVVNPAPK